MTNPGVRKEHCKTRIDLYNDIASGNLPAVSFVKPSGFSTAIRLRRSSISSRVSSKKSSMLCKANKALWADTAILITIDEGGGYYDSGYVQQLDFFGDGTRIPMIVVSPFTHGRPHLARLYRSCLDPEVHRGNWNLPPITSRSRDNLPTRSPAPNPYVPTNGPAIGDLMDLFTFKK